MLKKIVLAIVGLGIVASLALFLWARSVLTQDNARVALAGQLTSALGQPVTVGGVSATIYPRVTMTLKDVAIGEPARIRVQALDVGTDFRALLSRRIEHADLHLNGARVELPLPPLGTQSSTPTASPSAPSSGGPVEIVSIDEIVLKGVEVVSAGRTLKGDIEVVPQGKGVTLRKLVLNADDTAVTATGTITDLSGPTGDIQIKAGTLNFDKLLAFLSDFSSGAGVSSTSASAAPKTAAAPSAMNLTIAIDADKATMGAMTIDKVTARAIVKRQEVSLSPLAFNLFGGRYEGTLAVGLANATPEFHWKANVSGIDIASAAAFAGNPNTASGKLGGRIDLTGRGADAATAIRTARGTARIDAVNGVVNNLGLVRAVVAATSLNVGAVAQSATGSRDEPFSRLGATLAIANGSASTQDLSFESNDLSLNAAGALKLDGSAVNLQGQLQLSEALSKQAGGAVVRVTQQGGRVTIPATVTGAAGKYSVSVNAGDMAKRALKTEANEQAKKAITKGLGSFFKKK